MDVVAGLLSVCWASPFSLSLGFSRSAFAFEVFSNVAPLSSTGESYRQGLGMLLADPLSRVCAPTEGWYDPTLPRKLSALLSHLTSEVKSNENIRVYCHQDTFAAAKIVQKWRTLKNKVATGRLTQETKSDAFLIGTSTANSVVKLRTDNLQY